MNNETIPQRGEQSQCPSCVPKFLTVRQYAERYPWPSESALRWMIFHAATNGMESALIRVGRRVIIDVEAFNAWVHSQGKEC